jgi:hypothetical protein
VFFFRAVNDVLLAIRFNASTTSSQKPKYSLPGTDEQSLLPGFALTEAFLTHEPDCFVLRCCPETASSPLLSFSMFSRDCLNHTWQMTFGFYMSCAFDYIEVITVCVTLGNLQRRQVACNFGIVCIDKHSPRELMGITRRNLLEQVRQGQPLPLHYLPCSEQ